MKSVLLGTGLLAVIGSSLVGSSWGDKPPATSEATAVTLPKVVTYADHVAPLLNKRCVECHRKGEVAPFSLEGYANAKAKSAMISVVTTSKRMPPWKAVDGYGEFHDANRLSATDIALLKKWHETGAPRGNKSKEPAPPKFSGEWSLGKPDMIVTSKSAFKLGPEGDDVYRNFVIDPKLDKPVYVTAMDVRPGNTKIVHHVIAFLDSSGEADKLNAASKDGQDGYTTFGGPGFVPAGALGGWAPGVRPMHSAPKTGYLVKPGTKIVMQVHYHRNGKQESDQTRMALYFAKAPVEKPVDLMWLANPGLRLQPGKKDNVVKFGMRAPADVTIYTVMPHMHLLGRSMKAWIETPEGKTVPLVFVDDWDFNWQLVYRLKEPMLVKKGSRLRVEAVYDNSADNPLNPNTPPKLVTWGEQTTDEMALLIVAYTVGAQPK